MVNGKWLTRGVVENMIVGPCCQLLTAEQILFESRPAAFEARKMEPSVTGSQQFVRHGFSFTFTDLLLVFSLRIMDLKKEEERVISGQEVRPELPPIEAFL
nr:uncharacterized protein LOC108075987 [Drosophila kikkawai]